MPPVSALPQLQHLADRIGAALARPPMEMAREVQAALRDVTAEPNWLPEERRRASHDNYARHLLHADCGIEQGAGQMGRRADAG
jgi:predicted metal-dependent enzyme (double-stranded beta helix superfamily)